MFLLVESSQGGGQGTAASSEMREAEFSRIGTAVTSKPRDSLKVVEMTGFSFVCGKAVGPVLFGRCIRNASYLLGGTLSVD